MALLTTIHYLHLVFGVIWLGGMMVSAWALFPAMAKSPADAGKSFYTAISPYMGALMGSAGGLAMLTGLVRAWAGGGISGFSDLTSGYALFVLFALFVVIVHAIINGRERRSFEANLESGADNSGVVQQMKWTTTAATLIVLAIMTTLGLGLY